MDDISYAVKKLFPPQQKSSLQFLNDGTKSLTRYDVAISTGKPDVHLGGQTLMLDSLMVLRSEM